VTRLTREELAAEAGVAPGRVDALVRVGVIQPAPDGGFSTPDVARARIIDAYEAAGIGLDLIGHALGRRWITFDRIEDLYPDSGRKAGRTVAEFRASLGEKGHLVAPLLAAFGLPSPDDDEPLTTRDERFVADFIRAWDVGSDPDVVLRAGRLVGEAMRRIVDGWLELFAEQVTRPLEDRTRTVDEVGPIVMPRAAAIVGQTPELLTWLFQRHLEAGMDAQNVASMEAGLAREGLLPPRSTQPQAIAFVDLAGYTRLTETGGDELAARSAARLAELADDAARPHGGRLVKLLGDGAMLHFRDPVGAVRATLDLVDAIADAGLPPGHAGVTAGPLVSRDGDFFGHTVNLAARLSGVATAGVTLVTRDVTDAVDEAADGIWFEPVGDVALKNVAAPVAAFRAQRGG
jgi:adenylate cyclase